MKSKVTEKRTGFALILDDDAPITGFHECGTFEEWVELESEDLQQWQIQCLRNWIKEGKVKKVLITILEDL
jgi:hypothetical protein